MFHSKSRLMLICLMAIPILVSAQQQLPQLGKNPVQEVVAAMTLEEKVNLLVGGGMNVPGMAMFGGAEPTDAQKRVLGAAGTIVGVPRLGIPSLVVCDGPAGIHAFNAGKSRLYYATAWPIGTLLASSWDTTLVKNVGVALGKEAKEFGIDILLAPGMNIHRNPLGGRNFEYYSEDPFITGTIAAAMINGIQSNGVGVSAKHFFANNQETNRNTVNVIASERALREIYLKGWQIMLKQSKPWTIMSSYNLVNGPYTAQNPELLTTILRKEWGFKGFVMTDWFGGNDAVAMMKAGNNLVMPGLPPQKQAILEAVKSGVLDVKVLDQNVIDILNVIVLSPTFKGYKFSDNPDLKSNAKLSRAAAAEGMVLLKNNNNALPINTGSSVALIGINGYDLIAGGTGSGDVTKMHTVSLAEGLFRSGFATSPELYLTYTRYLEAENAKRPKRSMMEELMSPTAPIEEYTLSKETIAMLAKTMDHAIVSIGRNAGEGTDRPVEGNFNLKEAERTLLKNVSDAFHAQSKKVIVVLNIAGPIEVATWREYADAILLAWQPGLEGGNAIVDVVSGKVNPSGKLATTFPVAYADDITGKNFPGRELPGTEVTGMFGQRAVSAEVVYEEGIYVGYRYYNTFGVKPAYEFGYGLSYTTFDYSNLELSAATFNDKLTVSLTVTNTGKTAGKEVVQLYLTAPTGKLHKPAIELKGFAKTNLLQPGESQRLTFTLTAANLASYQTKVNTWIAEAGTYTIKTGTSQTFNRTATFKLAKEIAVEKTNKVLAPTVPIQELSGKPSTKKQK